MKLVFTVALVLTAFFAVSSSIITDNVDQAWENYKVKFGKGRVNLYGRDSASRKKIFARVHKMIVKHNSRNSTFTLEHNVFSVMTEEEKQRYFGLVIPQDEPELRVLAETSPSSRRAVPYSLDYRGNKCLGPIKNQGGCGSCYAFSALASLEFSHCKIHNSYVSLSEQQVVDCDKYDGGCGGGWMDRVWRYINENNGIGTTSSYPYVSGNSGWTANRGICRKPSAGVSIAKFYGKLPSRNPVGMLDYLVTYGPLAVTVSATGNFPNYRSGVYNDRSCDGNPLNHAVNIVGYGRDSASGLDYWIIRNSWGTVWGQAGYMLIQRGVNKCDIEANIYYVVAGQMNSNTDIDSELRSIEAQFGPSLAIQDLASKIVSQMIFHHTEYRWLSFVSITGIDGLLFVSSSRSPQQVYIHFNTIGNKHTMTFRSKKGPTNNPNKGSTTFVNSVRNAFIRAQSKYNKASEVLAEAKKIYSPIGNYQQIIFKTNQVTWAGAGFSFFAQYIGSYYVALIELPNP